MARFIVEVFVMIQRTWVLNVFRSEKVQKIKAAISFQSRIIYSACKNGQNIKSRIQNPVEPQNKTKRFNQDNLNT